MSLLTFKILATLCLFLTTIIAGLGPLWSRLKSIQHKPFWFSEAFASGVFLGAALFHLLPDATHDFTAVFGIQAGIYAYLIGFIVLLLLVFTQKVFAQLVKLHSYSSTNLIPYLLTFILCIHAFIDGSVVGLNSTLSATLPIFMAIIFHKVSESFSLATRLNCSEINTARVMTIFAFYAIITPIGVFFGTLAETLLQTQTGVLAAAIFNSIATGTFIYAAIFHHHKENEENPIYQRHENNPIPIRSVKHFAKLIRSYSVLLGGIMMMGLISIWV